MMTDDKATLRLKVCQSKSFNIGLDPYVKMNAMKDSFLTTSSAKNIDNAGNETVG